MTVIESVLPNRNNLINGLSTEQPRPAVQSSFVGNVASFADKSYIDKTFAENLRTRSLTSGNTDLDAIFDAAGRKYNISVDLLKAVARVESNFRPDATSRVGAMGIMQLMPGTAKYLGVNDAYDPEQNIMGGAKYLKEQLDRFEGDVELALAAYNAGWPAVKKHGGIPPFRETQAYVPKVLGYMGGGEITPNALTYSGFDMTGVLSDTVEKKENVFNVNDMLAQMLFVKMIEMQMNSGSNKSSRSI